MSRVAFQELLEYIKKREQEDAGHSRVKEDPAGYGNTPDEI